MYTARHWLYLNLATGNVFSYAPAWAAYRGLLATPNAILEEKFRRTHLGLTPHITRLFRSQNSVALEKEIELERVRRARFAGANSRLNCIYCWPDEETARLAPKYWSNQGLHFENKYLVEIGVTARKRPTIVDTRWIDKFVILSDEPLATLGDWWIDEYWKGTKFPWSGEKEICPEPLLECLLDGMALVYGTELRMEAYSIVKNITPDMTPVLERGRLGVDICVRFNGTNEWNLGQIVPTLMTNQQRSALQIKHLICLDNDLGKSINDKMDAGLFQPHEINVEAINIPPGPTFTLPDLRPVDADCSWLNNAPTLLGKVNEILEAFFLDAGGSIEDALKFQEPVGRISAA